MIAPRRALRFLRDFWRSARRRPVFRRCLLIASVVGSLLTVVNLGESIWQGGIDSRVALKILANFVVPFIVSNLGAMASPRPSAEPPKGSA